jgi:Domain of unknown function (DUF4878)
MTARQMEAAQTERRSIIPELVAAVVLIGLATGLALEHQTWQELREEQQGLRQQLDRVTDVVAENERQANLPTMPSPAPSAARDPMAELLRLRVEVGALRQLTNELERASSENARAHTALDRYLAKESAPKVATADFWPRESWTFAGYGTPDDALRSSIWASYNGDVKALIDGMTGDMRQTVEKENGGKSADEVAIRAMDEVSNLKSVQVLSREFQSDDTAVLTATFEDGDQDRTTKLILKRVGNEWKLAGAGDGEK